MPPAQRVILPLDNERLLVSALSGLKIGLVTNHTGVNRRLEPGAAVLSRTPGVKLLRLFAPEHGIYGDAAAGEFINHSSDPITHLPVISIYGSGYEPEASTLEGLDALVFDIQDLGVRYFTYVWTMVKCMEAARKAGLRFIVLDRPNPINGLSVAGNISSLQYSTLVGLYPVAARHGMTAGELAAYVNGEFCLGVDLQVVPLSGWRRSMWYDETGLLFVPPSPNATGLEMASVYTGTCLVEGTNASEGRGTTKPFETLGAPWVDPFAMARRLNELDLPGVLFRPAYFTPNASKHSGKRCAGVQVHVTDRLALKDFEMGLWVLHVLRRFPGFEWRYENGVYPIDNLAGTDELRLMIDEEATPPEIMVRWRESIETYKHTREKYLIYREE